MTQAGWFLPFFATTLVAMCLSVSSSAFPTAAPPDSRYWRASPATARAPSRCWGGQHAASYGHGAVARMKYQLRAGPQGLAKVNLTYANCCSSNREKEIEYEYASLVNYGARRSKKGRGKGFMKKTYGNPVCWDYQVKRVVRAQYENCCAVRSSFSTNKCAEKIAEFANAHFVDLTTWDQTWRPELEWRIKTGWPMFREKIRAGSSEKRSASSAEETKEMQLAESCSLAAEYLETSVVSGRIRRNLVHDEIFPCVAQHADKTSAESSSEVISKDTMLTSLGFHFHWDEKVDSKRVRVPLPVRNLKSNRTGKSYSKAIEVAKKAAVAAASAVPHTTAVKTADVAEIAKIVAAAKNTKTQLSRSNKLSTMEWVNPVHLAVLAEVLVTRVFGGESSSSPIFDALRTAVVAQAKKFAGVVLQPASSQANNSTMYQTQPMIRGVCQGAKKGYEVEMLRSFLLESLLRKAGIKVEQDEELQEEVFVVEEEIVEPSTSPTSRTPAVPAPASSTSAAPAAEAAADNNEDSGLFGSLYSAIFSSTEASARPSNTERELPPQAPPATSETAEKKSPTGKPTTWTASVKNFFLHTNFVDIIGTDFLAPSWLVWGFQDFATDLRPAMRNRWRKFDRGDGRGARPILPLYDWIVQPNGNAAQRARPPPDAGAAKTSSTSPPALSSRAADSSSLADFIYSNAFDHAMEPRWLLEEVWSKALRPNGLLILHWTYENNPIGVDQVDIYGATIGQLCNVLRKANFLIIDVLRIPVMDFVIPLEELDSIEQKVLNKGGRGVDGGSEREGVFLTPGEYVHYPNGTRKPYTVLRRDEADFVIARYQR
ncbi:unnamed protein product [Amoebophrya sp. A120]|nr:unnamed protein product [Amoebophrya sp. A120]|eukprot:GSA120T00016853001.1